jgi:hypothetical protein
MLLFASVKRINFMSLFFLSVSRRYDASNFDIASTNERLLDRCGSHRGIS